MAGFHACGHPNTLLVHLRCVCRARPWALRRTSILVDPAELAQSRSFPSAEAALSQPQPNGFLLEWDLHCQRQEGP